MTEYGRSTHYHRGLTRVQNHEPVFEHAIIHKKGRTIIFCEFIKPDYVLHVVYEKHMGGYLEMRESIPSLCVCVERQYELNMRIVEEGFFLT